MNKNYENEILLIENEISKLPPGSISKKTINGKVYYYHRFKENGKVVDKYVDFISVITLREEIELRKSLESKLKELKKELGLKDIKSKSEFNTIVLLDENLKTLSDPIRKYKKRFGYSKLHNYLYSDINDRVFILYGLRRTGKTTLIRQAISEMNRDDFNKTAYIQVSSKDNLSKINKDLMLLKSRGYKYVFIDEVTLMEDFIDGASLFSDIYASCGMKIVLSGTDSLGFKIAESNQLYDRCIFLHTTFIPYREFEYVLGLNGIDEYIKYGGTMSLSGLNYNEGFIFKSISQTNAYVDNAISKNIQHSLKNYQDGNHFRHLEELYNQNELTNVINRVIENINHKFTKDILIRDFRSSDLELSARNLRNDRIKPNFILDEVDKNIVNNSIKILLDIIDKNETKVELNEIHVLEIKEYLMLLDIINEIDLRSYPNVYDKKTSIVISQPGIRYVQAKALIESLLNDEAIINLNVYDRNVVIQRILSEISGRMMEEIVLLETKLANPTKEVFKLQFAIGEFDMVIFDKDKLSSEIYEIKYSENIYKEQVKHLIDEDKCAKTEFHFGKITKKGVIYRGNSKLVEGISYINVEEYLRNL